MAKSWFTGIPPHNKVEIVFLYAKPSGDREFVHLKVGHGVADRYSSRPITSGQGMTIEAPATTSTLEIIPMRLDGNNFFPITDIRVTEKAPGREWILDVEDLSDNNYKDLQISVAIVPV